MSLAVSSSDPGDAALAAEIGALAGRLLLQVQRSGLLTGEPLGAAGNALAQTVISRALHAWRPMDAILSQDGAPDRARLQKGRAWIIGPLDETQEFAELRRDWAVHVALTLNGAPGPAALVLPATGLIARTDRPLDLAPRANDPLRLVVSRMRVPELAAAVAKALGANLGSMGSVGANTLAVLSGEADIYLHAGGDLEWNTCAPVAVALAAGLHASRIDGSPCRYDSPDPGVPDLVICRADLTDLVLDAIEACRRRGLH